MQRSDLFSCFHRKKVNRITDVVHAMIIWHGFKCTFLKNDVPNEFSQGFIYHISFYSSFFFSAITVLKADISLCSKKLLSYGLKYWGFKVPWHVYSEQGYIFLWCRFVLEKGWVKYSALSIEGRITFYFKKQVTN